MKFRKDINGLRAIAVIAVVLFHFFPSYLPGGFIGVDVFFVISGFLMTGIIFRGLEQENFSNIKFYIARANRIIPALAFLCLFLLIFGFLVFTPNEFRELGKHIIGSIGFFSNMVYLSESGYFDTSSHEKWLLHTWSLSVEWQFYIIYPLVLSACYRFIPLQHLKKILIVVTIVSFIISILYTFSYTSGAYYLLSSRMWEMLIGGLAYLYNFNLIKKYQNQFEFLGLVLIFSSCLLILPTSPWPGYLALLPVLGTFLILQSNNNGKITNNIIFQKIGLWSYSIYLWHWPIAVLIHIYSLKLVYSVSGIILSILLGFLSHKFIEQIKFRNSFYIREIPFKCFPLISVYFIGAVGVLVYKTNGELALSSSKLAGITQNISVSPKRSECHSTVRNYIEPQFACDYFNKNANTAVFGDSHGVEIAYALAKELNKQDLGVKHLTFSACKPAYNQVDSNDKCVTWTNETVKYILENEKIENVVVTYRYSSVLFGSHLNSYPQLPIIDESDNDKRNEIISSLTALIQALSENKKNVIVIKPIPELGLNINQYLRESYRYKKDVNNIEGTSKDYYERRHEYILKYFEKSDFAENVKFVDPTEFLCDKSNCWAIRNSSPLYFDDNHLSINGAEFLVSSIIEKIK